MVIHVQPSVQSEITEYCHCTFFNFMYFMSFLEIHANHVKSCQLCQFMSNHVNLCHLCHLSLNFSGNPVKSGEGGGKYVFLGLRRQLRCQNEGKNRIFNQATLATAAKSLYCLAIDRPGAAKNSFFPFHPFYSACQK
jgi:hypothetical protein